MQPFNLYKTNAKRNIIILFLKKLRYPKILLTLCIPTVMANNQKKLSRKELIELGNKIINCEGTEDELDEMIDLFNSNVPHPNGANLFYYPEKYNSKKNDISKYNPTVEEVVDKALSYKPIKF
ncbi:bacteriocin immunity protein [Maribacter confluentis]|uniref:Bacteriocin immunity protein n=1 Tax=Maribacter confluentis TaxID=1656093 RepID=A0ABT8RQV0_9FLAO|nr:bacteriocin immunity protein [Maribacter confluentis]MDO1513277.1 bacteriocin immunity protein [Maribacter confluentis]